ncbi:olfactory receptor 13C8-like [Discoglossus pictus]
MIKNSTLETDFYLLAFSNYVNLQPLIFIAILFMYLVTMFGNMIITSLVCLVPQLHTPMYFFLCNLAIQDIIQVSAIVPKLLAISVTSDTRISFTSCITQMFLHYVHFVEAKQSGDQDKLLSMLYVVVVPMLNLLVYSLRNKEVLKALKQIYKYTF